MKFPSLFYFVVIIAIGYGLHHLFFSPQARIRSRIKRGTKKKIADVAEGEAVRISGKVIFAGRTLVAPLSKRKCVFYQVSVKDGNQHRATFKNYIAIDEERAGDLVIQDETHYAVISTKLVQAFLNRDENQYTGMISGASDELRDFLAKRGERSENILGWSLNLTAKEGVLEEGELIHVAGKGSWKNSSAFKFKLPVERVLYLEAEDEEHVYLTDDL